MGKILNNMKTLYVPLQNVSLYETVLDKMKILLEAGAVAEIDQVNWKDEFPEKMPVTVRVAHNNEKLYLYYTVIGEELRAVNTEDFGSVWEDSCVEFFMQNEGENTYRNFECNVLGVILAAHHQTREISEPLTRVVSEIYRHSTINHRYENGKQLSDWTMYLEIPKKAMGFKDNESLSGRKIRANFYKCGDKTSNPHYLSWNPIDLAEPNFHTPQFFGQLELE